MCSEYNYKNKKDLLRLALFFGELMLSCGAETYRVEDSVIRICKSRGFNHISVFTTPTVIIISDDRFDGYTFMKTIRYRATNLAKVDLLNSFSREFVNRPNLSPKDALRELKQLEISNPYPKYVVNLATAVGSASFAVLAGGDSVIVFILTLITSVLANFCYNKVLKISGISSFSTIVSSVFIGLAGVSLTFSNIIPSPKMLIVGSIMPLLPGVPFIKSIRDLISGDLISGMTLILDVAITAICIASGIGVVINIYFKAGGVL